MPKITSVEPQKKNPKRFNIFLDGQFAFGSDEDLIVDQRLIPGKTFTTSDVEHLLFEAEVGKLMERMYRLFNIRQRSEREVRNYLKNLSFKKKVKEQEEVSDLVIESLIEKLKQKGLLDDKQFASSWVQSRGKKKGKIGLKMELIQKGIAKEIIDELINQTPESEQLIAQGALEKKIRLWEKLPYLEFKKKAYEFLLRRGFEYEVVKDTIENFLQKRYNKEEE